MNNFFRTIDSPLARRIGIYVILASTVLSFFTSGLQIYTEYSREKNAVYDVFQQIEKTQLTSIASRVWVLDSDELNITLKNLLELSAVRYVAVYEEDELLMSVGNTDAGNIVERKFPLTYTANNKENNIGSLVVKASLDKVYQHVLDRAVLILLSNFVKTLIVAVFILFIFYKLVTRHISEISNFLSNEQSLSGDEVLSLSRSDRKEDELDFLVDAINKMKRSLSQQFDKINSQRLHLSQTLNSIGDAVITTDVKGKVVRMNPVAERLTGYSNKEAIGLSIRSVFPIIDVGTGKEIQNPIDKVMKTGNTVYLSNEATLRSKSGDEYHIADSAAPIKDKDENILGMVLVFNDITEQYKLQKEVAFNQKKYKILATMAPVGLFYTDMKGNCLYVNDTWCDIAGMKFTEALGTGWASAIYAGDQEKVFSAWNDFVNNDTDFKLEYRFQNGSEIRWVLGQALAEEDINGNIIGYVGTVTDITERKIIEHALHRSQKMDALGKLTGGIAHDYNNMLGVILGYAELLKAKLDDDPVLQDYIHEIYEAGNRGAKLTGKLLSFSRQRMTDSEVVDLNDIINSEQNMLEKTLTVNIHLIFDLEENIWPIKVDSGDLENVIVNLCINASHAMDGKGDLEIKTRNIFIDDKKYVSLTITDNGCGISEEEKEKIFDPFFTTKGDLGTGLGLSQVYGFVERAGGEIKIDSEVGVGTSFSLMFPSVIDVNLEENKQDDHPEVKHQHGSETILVVDDEVPLLSLCSEILSGNGYNVFTAESGAQALEILEQESINLLLSDVVMPNMNGYELAAIVEEKYPEIKIQMASGYTGENSEDHKNSHLHENILHKPYRIGSLLKRVRELLA